MEDTTIVEKEAAPVTEETTPETRTDATEVNTEETSKDIDYKKELDNLEGSKQKPSELEKARRSLFFNAQRFAELGGDPAEILPKPKETKPEETDVKKVIEMTFAEKEARSLARNDDEYNLIMWRVKNQGLSVEESYLLANKGKFLKHDSEAKRAQVVYSPGGGAGQKVVTTEVPERSKEEVVLLQRRGLKFNPQTKTWQGKHTEEYFDSTSRSWLSRRRTS